MDRSEAHQLSLFSQNLDRVAFLAYFLGGVVPLGGLGVAVHLWVLPALPEGAATLGAIGALLGLGVLSLAAFLALRRVTRATLASLATENERLESLFELSRRLSDVRFADEVHRTIAACAAQLCGAGVGLVVARDPSKPEDAPPQLVATSGDAAVDAWREGQDTLLPFLEAALENGAPALGATSGDPPARVAALPIAASQGLPPAALAVVARPGEAPLGAPHLRMLETVAALAGVARSNADLRDAQRNFFIHVTELLLAALDGHVLEPKGHARRVAQLSVLLGRELGLADARLERLHFAGLLHDVGMLKLDPRRARSSDALRAHTQLGHRMLSRIRLWEDLAPWVLHHHEWWSGEGHPDGLRGDCIPLEARIIGLAEAFEELRGGSGREAALPADEAVRAIERGAGTRFDPRLAAKFVELAGRGIIDGPTPDP